MITMGLKQKIIIGHFTDGKSERKLVKEFKLHRKTVHRYVAEHKALLAERTVTGDIPDGGIIEPPKYRSQGRAKRALTEEVAARIDHYLQLNADRREQGLHKQQMKRCDIHEALLDEGYQIGYTTVCNYVRDRLSRGAEAFIRQDPVPGQSVEFDWGEVKLKIDGKFQKFMLAVFTSAYSNFRYARLYDRQDMGSVLDAHVRFLTTARGVAGEFVYDNMRTAVAKLARRNSDKEPTEALAKLAAYYGFRIRFCNVRRGNEKGNVERSVEYVRRKAFSATIAMADLAAANDHLEQTCVRLNGRRAKGKGVSIVTEMNAERAVMKALPGRPYDTAEVSFRRVDKYGCVQVGNNHYSVPDDQVGQLVQVLVYVEDLWITERGGARRHLAYHKRERTQHQWLIQLDHFLPTLRKKPGALLGSRAWKTAAPALRAFHEDYFVDRTRAFIDLLLWARDEQIGLDQLDSAAAKMLSVRPHLPVDPDAIKATVRADLARTRDAVKGQGAGLVNPPSTASFAPASSPSSAAINDHADAQLAALQNLFFTPSNTPL
jgi:transposase